MAPLAVSSAAGDSHPAHAQVLGSVQSTAPARPKFNSLITSDRLREGAGLLPAFLKAASSNIRKDRVSAFKEMGLHDSCVEA